MKRQRAAYLYADGHAVICYEDDVVKQGTVLQKVEWVEIWEKWTTARCSFTGRLSFSPYESAPYLKLAKDACSIRARKPSVDQGSDNTKELGLAVGYLTFSFGNYQSLNLTSLPGVISCGFTYQDDIKEELFNPKIEEWNSCRVAKIHFCKTKQAAPANSPTA